MAADWSSLPAELAVLVAQRLTVYADHVRFGAACTAWSSAARARAGRPPAFLPYLLHEIVSSGGTVAFHSLSGGEILHAPFAKLGGVFLRCIASSNGWLLLTADDGGMVLFDPLSNSRVDLPSAAYFPSLFIKRGCVSSDGSRTVMVSYFDCQNLKCRLAYARPGDEAWTPIPFGLSQPCDSLHHHEGKFYAVEQTGRVLAIEITAADTPACEVVAPGVQHSENPVNARKFIVFAPSGEMVLLFSATWDYLRSPSDFMTFVLVNGGSGRTEWKPVDAKQVLGDVQVLVCHRSLFSIPRSILPSSISRLMPTLKRSHGVHHQQRRRQEEEGGGDKQSAVGVARISYAWFQPNYK